MAHSETPRRRPVNAATRRCRKRVWFVSLSAAIPSLVACPACAAKLEIRPTLSADTFYTDNVALAPAGGLKQSDWLTQLTPGVSAVLSFRQSKLTATYGAQALYSTQTGKSAVNHQFSLNSVGSTELVPQFLFLDANSSVGQQNVSLLAPQAQSNVNDTGNRATVSTLSVSPYIRYSFGQNAQALARFTYSTVGVGASASTGTSTSTSTAANIGRSQSTAVSMALTSGPAFKLTTWSLAYARAQTGYSALQDTTSETFTANAGRLVTPTLRLTASAGHETNNLQGDPTLGSGRALSGTTWNTGLQWTPSPVTNLSATLGKRPFGNSHTLDFSHRTRLTTWSIGYSESITTTQAQALLPSSVSTASYLDTLFLNSVPDPAARQLAVTDFIAQNGLPASLTVPLNFLTNQTFLLKGWRASFGIQGVRNTVLTNVFTQTSEALTAGLPASVVGDFGSSATVKQSGASALWNWRISTQSASNLSASYSRSEFPATGRTDGTKIVALSVSKQFQPKLSGSVNYRNLRNQSTQVGAEYTENTVSAALRMSF